MISEEFAIWVNRVVEVTQGYQTLLRCPVRLRNFVKTPEEQIRQGLLHFFVDLASHVQFELGAERQRHDIDLGWQTSAGFRPASAPLLIVETKVDQVAGEATDQQLLRYLQETNADCGVVFTGRRLWALEITANGCQRREMNSLRELSELVEHRARQDPLAGDRQHFHAAAAGDLDALAKLVVAYPFATFVLNVDGREARCRNLRFSNGALEFRPADYYARHPSCVPRETVAHLVCLED
jgi:hypothetical protein